MFIQIAIGSALLVFSVMTAALIETLRQLRLQQMTIMDEDT